MPSGLSTTTTTTTDDGDGDLRLHVPSNTTHMHYYRVYYRPYQLGRPQVMWRLFGTRVTTVALGQFPAPGPAQQAP